MKHLDIFWMEYYLWKNLLKTCVQHVKLYYQIESTDEIMGKPLCKAVKNVNDHLDALNIDVVENRNIGK